jgi:ferrous iron transport protein B
MVSIVQPADPAAPGATLTIALAGNPNCGKTTLFNALTGLRQKVANYPGITVEKKTGRCAMPDGRAIEVVDLPGTYSLISSSPDELVAMQVLRGLRPDTPPPGVIVAVVDASNLARNLYLVSQLLELGKPLVVALNMMDIAVRRGIAIDVPALAAALGVAVVPVVGHKRSGIDELKRAILASRVPAPPVWKLPEALAGEITALMPSVAEAHGGEPARHHDLARRLLVGDHGDDLDGLRRHSLVDLRLAAAHQRLEAIGHDAVQGEIEARYRWIDALVAAVARTAPEGGQRTLTERVDAVLVHRVWGLLIFTAIMATLFVSIFWLAKPIMDGLQDAIGWLGAALIGGMAEGPLKSLLSDGVIKGVGAVVVFVPQIALLFLFLAVLEDSGYLARAAFLMDKLLAKVGLHGKSFIPLLSSFACAIPGVMAARTIDRPRERLATILIAPFMSCSARLPVYALLIGAFFSGFGSYNSLIKGGILLGCYGLGIVAAALTALACKLFLGRGEATPFILEMPSYKLPQLSEVGRQVWNNSSKFLTKAGTTIFCLSVLLWALAYFPRLPGARAEAIRATVATAAAPLPADPAARAEAQARIDDQLAHELGGAQLAHSFAGRLGHVIEPVIAPLGFDWKMGVGLVGAFAAREVFVSTMGIVYGVGEGDDDQQPVQAAMLADRYADGRPVWTPLVAVSLLVWFVLAMQCMSTVAVVRRETGGWRWPLFQLAYMNALAYAAALLTYQVGMRLVGG